MRWSQSQQISSSDATSCFEVTQSCSVGGLPVQESRCCSSLIACSAVSSVPQEVYFKKHRFNTVPNVQLKSVDRCVRPSYCMCVTPPAVGGGAVTFSLFCFLSSAA